MRNTSTKKSYGAVTGSGPTNLSTKKKFNEVKAPSAMKGAPPRFANIGNRPGVNEGQVKGRKSEDFAEPMNDGPGVSAAIIGLDALHDDIGERSGFITDGYIDKSGTPYGEGAKLNFLPPGMEIDNQENAEINEMPLRTITAMSYPGDGWLPAPRDLPE